MLLIEFHFNSYGPSNSLSHDKYFGIDVWSQIYEKLQPKFDAFQQNETLPDETITLKRSQLELKTTWKLAKSYHKDILRKMIGKGCDSSNADVLIVKVGMISALDKCKKLYGNEKKTEKTSTESADSEPNVAKENRTSNGSTSQISAPIEEYVPEPLIDISSSLNYTPSTLSNSIENVMASPIDVEHTEYEPPLVTNGQNDSQVITYTPTKIALNSLSKAAKIKTDVNRTDHADKKTQHRMQQIFGGDSGDDIDSDSKSEGRRLRSTPQTDSDKSKVHQGNLDGWVSMRAKRTEPKTDGDRDDKKKMRKIATTDQLKREQKKTEDEKLHELANDWKRDDVKEAVVDRIM